MLEQYPDVLTVRQVMEILQLGRASTYALIRCGAENPIRENAGGGEKEKGRSAAAAPGHRPGAFYAEPHRGTIYPQLLIKRQKRGRQYAQPGLV